MSTIGGRVRRTYGADFQRGNAPMPQRVARAPLPAPWPPLALPASYTDRALVRHDKADIRGGEAKPPMCSNNRGPAGRATQGAPVAQPPIRGQRLAHRLHACRRPHVGGWAGSAGDIRVAPRAEGETTDRCKHVGTSRTDNADCT